jgi:ribonuclease HI
MITKAPHFLLYSEAKSVSSNSSKAPQDEPLERVADSPKRGEPKGTWHFVLRSSDGETRLEVMDDERDVSTERLELLAIVRGLEALDQPSRVTLVTTSSWIRRGLRFGLELWRENRWHWERFGRMTPIRNADLWQRIDRALEFHEIDCRTRQTDHCSDDLARPVPKSLREPRRSAPSGGQPTGRQARSRALSSPPQNSLARRLFSWCGLCRSDSSLLIAGS